MFQKTPKFYISCKEKKLYDHVDIRAVVVLDRNFNNEINNHIDFKLYKMIMLNAHKDWLFTSDEKTKFEDTMYTIFDKLPVIYSNLNYMSCLIENLE